MLASILIITFSSVLLLYWFRYTCILLVRNCAEDARSLNPAAQSSFSFADIQNRLQAEAPLDPLHSSLQRDYQVLTYLVHHASGLGVESFSARLLVRVYRL